MGKAVGQLTGGLLGSTSKPKVTQVIRPAAADKDEGNIDPNRSEAVAEARRRRVALSRRTGRSALRVDLSNGGSQTRSGISII